MTARRRSARLMKNDPELLPNESDLSHEDREGPSDRSPYHEAKQALREMAGDSFEDTDEDFEITQDDEDGQVGVRLLRTSRRPSPNVQSSAKSRTRSRSKRRDETSTDVSYIFFPSNSTELNLKKYEAFKIQVNERFKTPNQRNLQSIMYYLGRRITGIDKSTDPLFILVAASNEKQLLKFLKDFKDLLNESKEMELLNLTSLSNRLELSANVSRILDEGKGVILHRIDRLTADTPQVLHAMSDSETAPHKCSILVGTIELPTKMSPELCSQNVQSYLENEWRSEKLPLDQISPILSRITSFTLCID